MSDHCLFTAAEAELINRVVSLGYQYKLIKDFVDRYSGLSGKLALHLAYSSDPRAIRAKDQDAGSEAESEAQEGEEEQQMNGVYIKAFCSGVSEVIAVYK